MIDVKTPLTDQLTQVDFKVIDEIISTLEPVALAVEVLSRRDVNLITAEAALEFCVLELRKQQSALAKAMAMALHLRITQRYASHSVLLDYLHKGVGASSVFEGPVATSSKTRKMKKLKYSLFIRLDKPGK
jgi:hypothetical protein